MKSLAWLDPEDEHQSKGVVFGEVVKAKSYLMFWLQD